MKVLRTAIFSTLLIICFAQIGQAQLISLEDTRGCSMPTALGVSGGSMTDLGDGKLRIIYNALATNACGNAQGKTEIICKGGTVVFSQTFGNGTLYVNKVIDMSIFADSEGRIDVDVECNSCEGNTCHREGAVVQIEG